MLGSVLEYEILEGRGFLSFPGEEKDDQRERDTPQVSWLLNGISALMLIPVPLLLYLEV